MEESNTSQAARITSDGTAQMLALNELPSTGRAGEFTWIHINRYDAPSVAWLKQASGLDPIIINALLAEETRPRCTRFGDGYLLNLRGVNLNPGSEPDDMVSIRMWVEESGIISVYLRRLGAVKSLWDEISQGRAPTSVSQLVIELTDRLASNAQPVIENLSDAVNEIEEEITLTVARREIRVQLGDLRRQIIRLRRYLAPQREALGQLLRESINWITQRNREEMQQVTDQMIRIVEELDNLRDRAAVVQDEVESRISDALNHNMYLLSIVAVVFLPLGFITGLLGINVAGIPGSDTSWAFAAVLGALTALAILEIIILKRMNWL